jgi:transcriptional regulator with XRE-family HTH domain
LAAEQRSKLSHNAIARLETGKRQITVDDLVALARAYNVDPAAMLTGVQRTIVSPLAVAARTSIPGSEHYLEAEKWLDCSHRHTDQGNEGDERIAAHAAAQAQVHATLALAAATIQTDPVYLTLTDRQAWQAVGALP